MTAEMAGLDAVRVLLEEIIAFESTDFNDFTKIMRMRTLAREALALLESEQGERIEGWALEERITGRSTHIFNSIDIYSTAPRAALIIHSTDAILGTPTEIGD